ncbi:MAG TPA: hypothetical protein VFC71_04445 [Candidatus Polarisedimenticolia bacterium]|nr:hypothetical protein [Candidatus Polarisedimenticolia bacterium]
MRTRFLAATAIALTLVASGAAAVSAHPDNAKTLHFVLTCDDGNVWNASFNGGPAAFHLDAGQLYIWKQIDYVTPDGQSGTLTRGIQGFAAESTVTCTYTGAVSGNAYTVTGFYPPAD